jgi:SWI/SNF-related matrix-associated actin-dependent regulator of chromatin subfamily D
MEPMPPVTLDYTIRVDKEFHDNPQPTIYDIQVQVDDPLRASLISYLTNDAYTNNLLKIGNLNEHVAILTQKIGNSKSKHTFFDLLSKNPTEFITKCLSSQNRDLEIVCGDSLRGGGDGASSEEWRKGGKDGIWGSANVRESVNLLVSQKVRG